MKVPIPIAIKKKSGNFVKGPAGRTKQLADCDVTEYIDIVIYWVCS